MIRTPTTRDYLSISLFWLGFSFFWGALLYGVLQARVQTFVENEYSSSVNTSVNTARVAPLSAASNRAASSTSVRGQRAKTQLAKTQLAKTEQDKVIESRTASKLSWLLGTGALISTITQLVFGALSDGTRSRWGRRKPYLVAGVLLANIGVILFPFARSYSELFGVYLLIQFFLNIASGPYSALLPDLVPVEFHGRAAAFMGFFALVGRTGGMVAGASALRFLAPNIALNVLTIAFLVLLNGLMAATALMTRETPSDFENETSSTRCLSERLRDIFRIDLRQHSSFVWVLVSRFVINTGVYTIMPFLLYYLMNCFGLDRGDALIQLIVIGLLVNVMGLIATFPAGIAGDRMSKKRVVYATCVLCIIGGLGFVFSSSLAFALIAAAIFGLGYGAFQAVDWALICNVLPPGQPAKYMGLWSCADNVPQIVAPFIGGAVASYFINHYNASVGYRAVMFTAIVWFVLGTFFIRFVKERSAQEIRDAQIEVA